MSRKPKKRNKPYTGEDAAAKRPVVHKYHAVVRSPLGEWWIENKRRVRIVALIALAVLLIAYVVYELTRLF